MNYHKQLSALQRLVEQSFEIEKKNNNDPRFKSWKNNVYRTLVKYYGPDSLEFKQFDELTFFYNPDFSEIGEDLSLHNEKCFNDDLQIGIKLIESFIDDLNDQINFQDKVEMPVLNDANINKIFISHSSKDKVVVEELIEILEVIGLRSEEIFCSSFEGYGVKPGQDFLNKIKNEISSQVLVVFILSKNYYESPYCLCEMGASWVKTNEHIPILIPPFDYIDIQGVFPTIQGLKMDEPLKLNLFKEKIEKSFKIKPIDSSIWERKRNRIIKRINENIN